jgi:serine phosphatase RsbU (regulator of sigma subunit)/PAS domain-containing protein/anti-sigma regulatory factor (Ser/Thr protein kinase)
MRLAARRSPTRPGAPSSDGSERGRAGVGRSLLNVRSVVGQMFMLQLIVVLLFAAVASVTLVLTAKHDVTEDASARSLALADGYAHAPGLVEAIEGPDPSAALQPKTMAAARVAGVDFLTVLDRRGIRLAASSPGMIGTRTLEQLDPLLAGQTIQRHAGGALGPQVRAFVPVRDADGTVVGAVGAGVTIKSITGVVDQRLPALLGAAAAAVAVTTGGAALLGRRLLRQTRGMGPAEITRMYEHQDAVLHATREGVLIVGGDRRVLLANDEARRLLALPPDVAGRRVTEIDLPPPTAGLLTSRRDATDEAHVVEGRVLSVNQRPIDRYGTPAGSVMTLRDSTELAAASGRAEAATARLKLLYDASLGIGTTLDVGRTARELAEVSVPRLADFATVDLVEAIVEGDGPQDAQRRLLRGALAGIRPDPPLFPVGTRLELAGPGPQQRCMAAGRGLIEPDLREATDWRAQAADRSRRVIDSGIHSLVAVPLYARGVILGVATFWRSEKPEPFDADDLALAEELAGRAGVCIDNARQYTHEHAMAAALQRSLLPSRLPEQNSLEVAYRYLPAQEAVGGDWFDIIPLPGARVALVVGDVVGHGIHAAATMGRLRTAVHNFSSLDLPPAELLAHLDELADSIDRGGDTEQLAAGTVGATCLYAVYDPVEGRCSLARAGHLPPAIVRPDGTVEFLDVPAGPPLGVGGPKPPFETAEVRVAEGTKLVFYTDGLVENRGEDIDRGLDRLRAALANAPGTPDETCRAVVEAMRPEHPSDDVAVLIARTRILPAADVCRWDVPADPEAVGRVRTAVADKLAEWDLEEASFTTELILSELVTNAMRYTTGRIGVRLLLDSELVCEVSDASTTTPHLRYAATTDEGGRGLYLVDQIADRWGIRYTADGKVIWSEQKLPPAYRPPAPPPGG